MKLTSTLLFPLALLSGAFASDDAENATNADTKVEVLTTDTFDDYIKHDSLVLVKFYAPWCGHCKSMAPAYDKASITLAEKNIKLGKVDCTVETELCNKYDVQGFPTLKIFSDGENSEYNGGRDEEAIVSTMVRKSLPAVSELTSENFEEFSTSEKVVVIGYFDDVESDEYKVFEKAAKNLNDDYTFGAVVDSKLAKKHKVKVPAVVVHKKFDEPTADVEYNEDHKALIKDIKSAATPLIGDIGPQNYGSYVESKLPLAYIFIETEEQREEFEPIFKPIAKEHKGDINFVFINATMFGRQAEVINLEQKFPAFGIQQLDPAAKFPFDQSKDLTEKALAKFVKDFAAGKLEPSVKSEPIPEGKDGNTTVLVAKNFVDVVLDKTKDVLVEFYAPWCGHCKRLAPIYDELAALYPEDSNVVVAKFDAIANDIPVGVDVEVQGFPTIKLFKAKDNKVIDFEGERTVEGFVNFLNDNADSKFEPELPASEDESEEKEDAEEEEL